MEKQGKPGGEALLNYKIDRSSRGIQEGLQTNFLCRLPTLQLGDMIEIKI